MTHKGRMFTLFEFLNDYISILMKNIVNYVTKNYLLS